MDKLHSDAHGEELLSTDTGDDSASVMSIVSHFFSADETGMEDDCSIAASVTSCNEDDVDTALSLDTATSFVYPPTLLLRMRAGIGHHLNSMPSPFIPKFSLQTVSKVQGDLSITPPSQALSAKHSRKQAPLIGQNSLPKRSTNSNGGDKVARSARSILNKLTVEKFDSLYEQLATCGIETLQHVTTLMQEVFEKAIMQHHFIPMYADLCVRLETDPRIQPALEGKRNNFRRLLLSRCQTSFEMLLKPPPMETYAGTNSGDLESQQDKRKRRALGNVKLVAELIVRGSLISRLLVDCSEELLNGWRDCQEALESLCALLTAAGKKFDIPEWPHHDRLKAVFARIQELAHNSVVPARQRFLLQNVLDLREKSWVSESRAAVDLKGPMRLEEVRERHPKHIDSRIPGHDHRTKDLNAARFSSLQHILSDSKGKEPKAVVVSSKTSVSSGSNCHSSAGRGQWRNSKEIGNLSNADGNNSCAKNRAGEVARTNSVASNVCSAPVVILPCTQAEKYDPRKFHRELSNTLRCLASDWDVNGAVARIRMQNVPKDQQALEFANLLTRIAEEGRAPERRSAFAFAAGLAATECSTFDTSECLAGTRIFFEEVYVELSAEVPRLPVIVTAELIPILSSTLPAAELNATLPEVL